MKLPPLYGITDSDLMPHHCFQEKTEAALKAGLKLIQYRDKSKDGGKRICQARALLQLCKKYQAKLIINDDIELARQVQAHGVHLGQEDESPLRAREILGGQAIIGVTCHNSLPLAKNAVLDSANYVAFGRLFPSRTKRDAKAASLTILRDARSSLSCPIVAIGGITSENAVDVWRAGAHSVAVCHDLFAETAIEKSIKNLNVKVNTFYHHYQSLL